MVEYRWRVVQAASHGAEQLLGPSKPREQPPRAMVRLVDSFCCHCECGGPQLEAAVQGRWVRARRQGWETTSAWAPDALEDYQVDMLPVAAEEAR